MGRESAAFVCVRSSTLRVRAWCPYVRGSVAPGSVVHTDGWAGYLPLERNGYQQEVTVLKRKKKTPSESRSSRCRPLRPDRPPNSAKSQTTICWGSLSEGHTHLADFADSKQFSITFPLPH